MWRNFRWKAEFSKNLLWDPVSPLVEKSEHSGDPFQRSRGMAICGPSRIPGRYLAALPPSPPLASSFLSQLFFRYFLHFFFPIFFYFFFPTRPLQRQPPEAGSARSLFFSLPSAICSQINQTFESRGRPLSAPSGTVAKLCNRLSIPPTLYLRPQCRSRAIVESLKAEWVFRLYERLCAASTRSTVRFLIGRDVRSFSRISYPWPTPPTPFNYRERPGRPRLADLGFFRSPLSSLTRTRRYR